MSENLFITFFLFIFGINVGSFLNVLIDRLPHGEQVLKGRSYCDHCKHKLSWLDLIPIFSWIVLGARCRYCRSPINWYYPSVEFLTGLLFVLVYVFHLRGVLQVQHHLGGVWGVLFSLFIISSLIVIFFADLKYQIIPDQIVYPAIIIAFIFQIIDHKLSIINFANPLLSALGTGLFFLLIILVTRGRGMGWGDVKLAVLMGLILGSPYIIVALYLAFLTGALVGVILILTRQKKFGQHIPFGPFLVSSTIVSLWWGENLWQILIKILGVR